MSNRKTIAFLYAHPDDETFGCSYLIRQIADEGGQAVLLTATRGDAGKTGHLGEMTREQLAARRDKELDKAAEILGISVVEQLGLPDGKLSEVDPTLLREKIADFLQRHQAEVVITFPEDGLSGHPDHIAIHYAVNEVVLGGHAPTVQKLYYNQLGSYTSEHSSVLRVDGGDRWEAKRQALAAHESQVWSVERVFGVLGPMVPPGFEIESFELVWERGERYPQVNETSIYDGLL
ncbi:PIG-L deacetylase family protein [Paenibacillus rubinfantis]|uniref:PIG-L deacetylase family protein n=1 Tax=Paenibacillus rubinfantis TaxID=1720296 RepID=UPI00073F5409|nr:PIG-L family deacetylase [Paenibacillus rubinfantis]